MLFSDLPIGTEIKYIKISPLDWKIKEDKTIIWFPRYHYTPKILIVDKILRKYQSKSSFYEALDNCYSIEPNYHFFQRAWQRPPDFVEIVEYKILEVNYPMTKEEKRFNKQLQSSSQILKWYRDHINSHRCMTAFPGRETDSLYQRWLINKELKWGKKQSSKRVLKNEIKKRKIQAKKNVCRLFDLDRAMNTDRKVCIKNVNDPRMVAYIWKSHYKKLAERDANWEIVPKTWLKKSSYLIRTERKRQPHIGRFNKGFSDQVYFRRTQKRLEPKPKLFGQQLKRIKYTVKINGKSVRRTKVLVQKIGNKFIYHASYSKPMNTHWTELPEKWKE